MDHVGEQKSILCHIKAQKTINIAEIPYDHYFASTDCQQGGHFQISKKQDFLNFTTH